MKTLAKITFGSHLYGTNTPESDFDFKFVHVPDARDILLGCARESIKLAGRDKQPGEKTKAGETEIESYSLQKFFDMVIIGDMIALDMLFAPTNMLVETSYPWMELVANRSRFLTRNVTKSVAYCKRQAKVYGIKGTRVAAIRAVKDRLQQIVANGRGATKLYRFGINLDQLSEIEHVSVHRPLETNVVDHYLMVCDKKFPLTCTVEYVHDLVSKMMAQYGTRALDAEQNKGIDWKALSHAVRVGMQTIELLETKNIVFPSLNADYLKAIKAGELPYTEVEEKIEKLLVYINDAAKTSWLPDEPDLAWIEWYIARIYGVAVVESSKTLNGIRRDATK
jgi:hypothetical protein